MILSVQLINTVLLFSLAFGGTTVLSGCGGPQERKATYRSRAEAYLKEGNLPKARVAIRNVLQIDPKDTEAYLLWAQIEESERNWRNAFAHYLRILEINPDHEQALIKIGKFYLEAQEVDKVGEISKTLAQRFPGHVTAEALRIAAEALKGHESVALEEAKQLADRNPDHIDAGLLLANLYAGQQHLSESIGVLQKIRAQHTQNTDVLSALAAMYVRNGDPDSAEPILKMLVDIQPTIFEHRMKLARYYDDQHNVAQAESVLRDAVNLDPANESRHLTLSDYVIKRRGPADAELILRSAIEQLPRSGHLKFALGDLYEATKQPAKARDIYLEVIEQNQSKPIAVEAQVKLAQLAWLEGHMEDAAQQLQAALQTNPRSTEGLLLQGRMALQNGEYPQAIQALRTVAKDQPEQAPAQLLLGQAYLGSGDKALARESLERAILLAPGQHEARQTLALLHAKEQRLRDAKEQLNLLLGENPLDIKTLALLTQILLESRQWDAAADTAARLKEAGAPPAELALIDGQIAEGRHEWETAAAAYLRANVEAPADPRPLVALVHVYGLANKLVAARTQLTALITQNPGHPYAHSLLGEVLVTTGDLDEANRHYREAVRHNPSWAYAWLGWAALKIKQGQPDQAIRILRDALTHTTVQEDLRLMLASLLSDTKQIEAAIQEYEVILARQPRLIMAANNLATLLVESKADGNSLARAFALAKDLEAVPNPVFQDTAGWVHVKMGHVEEGIRLISQAVAQLPEQPQFHYHLGYAYFKAGKSELAKSALEHSLKKHQTFPGEAEARTILDQLSHHSNSLESTAHAKG